jgi:FixJ family two-component response regulator
LLAAVRSTLNRQDSDSKQQAERAAIDDRLAGLSNREREVLEGLVAAMPTSRLHSTSASAGAPSKSTGPI